MKHLLALLTVIFALGANADAIVFIYSGSTSIVERPDSPRPSRYRTFVLYEPSSRKLATVSTWRVGTQKVLSAPSASVFDLNVTTRPDGRTETVLSTGLHIDLGGGNFVNGATLYRGTRLTLKVNTNGLTSTEARVFNGTILAAALTNSGTDSSTSHSRTTASYSTSRSIKANDANQTLDQARAALIAELNAQGFQ